MSAIQNQTVLFVPHLDLFVKASNTLASPFKHNFKHQKLMCTLCFCKCPSQALFPCDTSENPGNPGISVVAKKESLKGIFTDLHPLIVNL